MKMGPNDFSDLSYQYDASFVGASGRSYLCEKDFTSNTHPRPRFCFTLPNGVVFKMADLNTYDSGIFGGLREAWAIFLDDDRVGSFEDTKEIKDTRLRTLAEGMLADLLAKAKSDARARKEAYRTQSAERETKRQKALKKLDQ